MASVRRVTERFHSCQLQSANQPETPSQLTDEQLRLLERGEMPTARKLVEIDQLLHAALGPAARSGVDVFWRDAAAHRQVELDGAETAAETFPVQPRG